MSLFSRHVDRKLGRLAAGTLSPAEAAALLEHVRSCPRCAARYDRVALGLRALENGTTARPSAPEREALRAAGLNAALAAAREAPAPGRRWALPALGVGLAAAAGLVLFVARPGIPEWSARGGPGAEGALRVFCDRGDVPLAELRPGVGCPAGARLAFAAGHRSHAGHVAVRVRAGERTLPLGTHPVAASLDTPTPLPVTPTLELPAGAAVVEAAFGETREQAEAALAAGHGVRLEFAVEAPR